MTDNLPDGWLAKMIAIIKAPTPKEPADEMSNATRLLRRHWRRRFAKQWDPQNAQHVAQLLERQNAALVELMKDWPGDPHSYPLGPISEAAATVDTYEHAMGVGQD